MFGPDERNPDPVWSKPPEPPTTQILPWQANLPSFYTNWSPTSSRKLARPAAHSVPTGQPKDPNPQHYNRPSPSRSSIYRRVMFRPLNSNLQSMPLSSFRGNSLDETDDVRLDVCPPIQHRCRSEERRNNNLPSPEINVKDLASALYWTKAVPQTTSKVIENGSQQPSSADILKSNACSSEQKIVEDASIKSESQSTMTHDANKCISSTLPNSEHNHSFDERRSRSSWRRQYSVSDSTDKDAMVAIPSKPIRRTQVTQQSTVQQATENYQLYQNVPWRSPQSNRKMFAKFRSLSSEESDNPPNIALTKGSAFDEKTKETSSEIFQSQTIETSVSKPSAFPEGNSSSKLSNTYKEQKNASTESEHAITSEQDKVNIIGSSAEENGSIVAPNIETITSAVDVQGISPDEVNEEEKITSTEIPEALNISETPGMTDSTNNMNSDTALQNNLDLQPEAQHLLPTDQHPHLPAPPPPPPPPPPRKMIPETTPNSTRKLLANVVRYNSIEEAKPVPNDPKEKSPEYERENVTSRIQRFEKQSSTELEVSKPSPIIKPVAPWVKKTSTGPVTSDAIWESGNSSSNPILIPQIPTEAFTKKEEPPTAIEGYPDVHFVSKEEVKPFVFSASSTVQNTSYHEIPQNSVNEIQNTSSTMAHPETGVDSDSSPLKKNDDTFDPWCDPDNPRVIQFQDVSAAAFKIKSGIINTPCTYSNMSTLIGSEIFFKKEFTQYTGSFKERGARYALLCLSEEQKKSGVIAASAGNHALALSYHAKDLNIPVTVVMPIVAPIMKVQACRQYGANVIVQGNDIGECKQLALTKAKKEGLLYINGYDHPQILAGQGTMGLEIVEQVPNIDAVIVPIGGGGLIAGVALAVKSLYPHIQVIGVESETCASFSAAMKAQKPVYTKADSSLADGLAVPVVGVNAFATASTLIDKVVTVREEWIAIAILRLVEMEKAVVEGAGATGLAALLAGDLPELQGKRVVIPLCGGNIDTTILGRCLERGLAADGRLVKFTVTVSDRPGGIAELTRLLSSLGVSIKDMLHERAWIKNDIFSVEVKVVCETRDYEHFTLLRTELEKRYKRLRFPLPAQVAQESHN